MGTPEFAVGTLSRLVEGGYNIVAVVTQPDKPVGRHGSVLQPSEVKKYALAHGLPVLQPEKMKDPDFIEQLKAYEADLQVVVAFRMLPEVVWAMPRYGTFNVHAALLPQYRGAAPINWAIINGEKQTGVTTFFLDHAIDTGRIILQKTFDIPDDANVEYVYNGLMTLGADITIETIDRIIEGNGHVESVEQLTLKSQISNLNSLKTAPKIFKETCEIDWNQPAKKVHNFIRGLSPYPGAWTRLLENEKRVMAKGENPTEGTVLKIFKTATFKPQISNLKSQISNFLIEKNHLYIACSDTWLEILELQLAGKKRMDAGSFINGYRKMIE